MLPLWRDQLNIVLTPAHVTVVRLVAGLKPREVFNKTIVCTAPAASEAVWQPAIRALRQLLRLAGATKANAKIVLSNHFARYLLVKAQSDLGSLAEEQGFVRFSFAEIYGNEAAGSAMRWGSGLDLTAQVASAIDQALLDNLANVFAEANIKLTSLQPYLMAAFNHVRQSVDAKPVWFVLVEPGRLCIGLLKDGEWKTLSSSKLGADWATELPNLIEREFHKTGVEGAIGNMLLCLPDYFDHKRLATVGQVVRILTMTPEKLQRQDVLPISRMGAQS